MTHTLEMYEELKAANLTENQSRAIVQVMQSVVAIGVSDSVRVPQFQLGFQELRNDLQSLRQEFRQEIASIRQEFRQEISSVRMEFRQEMALLKQELQKEMQKMVSDLEMRLIKYIFAQGVVVIGSVVTLLHFLK